MSTTLARIFAALLLVSTSLVAGCSILRERGAPPHGEAPFVVSVESVAALPDLTTNARGSGRDAGSTGRVGENVVWLFGDTFIGDEELICATAAWSTTQQPGALFEEVDETGRPRQLYPFSPEEAAFNVSHETPPACCRQHSGCAAREPYCRCPAGTDCAMRIALWPGDIAVREDGVAVNVYERVLAGVAPYDFTHLGTGLAVIEEGRTVARRLRGADGLPRMLFDRDEPNFLHLVVGEPDTDPGTERHVYAYAVVMRRGCSVDVLAARAPLARMEYRDAWRFHDGSGWSEDLAQARPILSQVPAGLGSVAWSDYLGAYVSGINGICTGGSRFLVRTAPRPEGPWSDPAVVDLAPLGADAEAYAGRLHPVFGRGRDLMISFYQPKFEGGRVTGRVHPARIRFR